MTKFKFNKKSDELFKAVLALKNKSEAEAFFRDLCTIEELEDMCDRWAIVSQLNVGEAYRDIAESLKVSTTTVSRVANWLTNGMGGYELIWNRLNHHRSPSGGSGLRS